MGMTYSPFSFDESSFASAEAQAAASLASATVFSTTSATRVR